MTATAPQAIPAGLPPGAFSVSQLIDVLRDVSNQTLFGAVGTAAVVTSATTYTSATGASQIFTKNRSSALTDVIGLILVAGFRSTSTAPITTIAISDGTTDWPAAIIAYNTVLEHMAFGGMARMTGLAAGTYTMTLRAKESAATGSWTLNSGDPVSMMLMEVPVSQV